jgi:hypothetical protein
VNLTFIGNAGGGVGGGDDEAVPSTLRITSM